MKRLHLALVAGATYAFSATAFANGGGTQVPEPGTLGLLAAGIASIVAVRLIKRK